LEASNQEIESLKAYAGKRQDEIDHLIKENEELKSLEKSIADDQVYKFI